MASFDEVLQQFATQDSIKDVANQIDESKANTKTAFDLYTSAIKSILEWCGSTTPQLDQLINNEGKSEAQRNALETNLEDGLQKMEASQNEIAEGMHTINYAIGHTVPYQIAADFDNKTTEFKEEHREFYENLKTKIQNLNNDVSNLKTQFEIEIQIIGNLKIVSESIEGYLGLGNYLDHDDILRDIALKSINKLSVNCSRYRKRHE